jgi:hypothetical protein
MIIVCRFQDVVVYFSKQTLIKVSYYYINAKPRRLQIVILCRRNLESLRHHSVGVLVGQE